MSRARRAAQQHPLGVSDVPYRGYMIRNTFAGLHGYTVEIGHPAVAIAREVPSIEEEAPLHGRRASHSCAHESGERLDERAMNATLSGRITCRADGAVFLALIARGWVLVALADGWARMEPKTPQRSHV